jgi:hypothetical protein
MPYGSNRAGVRLPNDPNKSDSYSGKYSRYKRDKQGVMQFKGNAQKHCWRLWHDPVITWDGAVVPCCFDKTHNTSSAT